MTIAYQYKCPSCGLPLSAESAANCENCGVQFFFQKSETASDKPDPDNPSWDIRTAIAVWVFSVLLILAAPLLANLLWPAWQLLSGKKISGDIHHLLSEPAFIYLFMTATMAAQIFTLLIAYRVVTSGNKDFFASLGWHWHPRFKLLHAILFTIFVIAAAIVISNILPNHETDLERLLKVSMGVRIFTAALAILTAPLIEEVVYRGILYSAFRKRLGIWPAILIVSAIFVGVHVPQYWGGWGVLASLSLLSFGLTLVRAYTSSLLPSYMIHLLFNCINAVGIIAEGLLKSK